MARKKSASKRAREEAEKAQKLQEQEQPSKEEIVNKSVQNQVEDEFSSDEESSSSEEEDDYGELITDDVEQGIDKVLQAIKNGDKSLFDPNVKFFNEIEAEKQEQAKKQKPIYLKDYHRMNLLSGDALKDEEEEQNEGEEQNFKTYDQEKQEERNEILSEIKNAFNEADESNEEEDDGFMKKKEQTSEPIRSLPNPNEDEEKFLNEFAHQQAWIPHKGDKIINLDRQGDEDEDEEFEEAAEKFEHAYNFRYEDPNAAEIISYARNQATVRRSDSTGRRKQREAKKEEAKKLKQEKEAQITKKKNEKINKLADILEQIKKDYGAEINEDMVKKISNSLLDKDFDDSQWDTLLQELFNDEFYNDAAVKPEWDEDDEIMKDFKPSGDAENESESESESEKEDKKDDEDQGEEIDESDQPPKKKSKKDQIKEKNDKKKEKKRLKELAEKAVEANKLKIIDQVEEEREGRSKEKKDSFKYREVSPETFGLTTREILIADDSQLNEFVGLKKYAPYRPKDQRLKDRRKLAKAKQLKEWRKKVFKNEQGPIVDENDKDGDVKIPIPAAETKQKKVHKRKHNSK